MAIKIPRGELPTPSIARNTSVMDLASVGSRSATSAISALTDTSVSYTHLTLPTNREV